MNEKILNYFKNIVTIKVEGKNINRFLTQLYRHKFNVLDTKHLNRNQLLIKLYLEDYNRLMKIKTTSEIRIISFHGGLRLKHFFYINKMFLSTLLAGYIFLLVLSNMIFEIQVIHEDKEIRQLITQQLKEHNIRRLQFKKSYEKLEKIEDKILSEYKNKIEWLEIEEIGTKYIVRVEERKIIEKPEEYIYQDIVAAKDAVIKKIEAESGVVVKNYNNYVKKGDVVISGQIMSGEKLMDIVKASGKIFGEVWYNIRVEFPMIRSEKKETRETKTIYGIRFLKFDIPILDFKPFKSKRTEEEIVFSHRLIPFQIIKQKQYELDITEFIYTDSEALIEVEKTGIKKVEDKLTEEESIIGSRIINYYIKDEKIFVDLFLKVYENITETREISLDLEE